MKFSFFSNSKKNEKKYVEELANQKNELRDIRHTLQGIINKNNALLKIQNDKKSDYIYMSTLYSSISKLDRQRTIESETNKDLLFDDLSFQNLSSTDQIMIEGMRQMIKDENESIKSSLETVSNDIKKISKEKKLIDATFALLLSINLELNQQLKGILTENENLLHKIKGLESKVDYQRSEYVKIFS
jgi:hypothetical protein